MITGIVNYLIDLAGQLGYIGIVFIVGLEYACFPIPSEVVLPFVGMSVAGGEFSYIGALIASVIGGVVGSWICYLIGFIGGVPLLEWSSNKWPKTKRTIIALDRWFAKYGNIAVLLTRLFPLTRTYISILAGAQQLSMWTFTAYSLVGIIGWNTILVSMGYFLGDNMALIEKMMGRYSTIVIALAVVVGVVWFIKVRGNKKKVR